MLVLKWESSRTDPTFPRPPLLNIFIPNTKFSRGLPTDIAFYLRDFTCLTSFPGYLTTRGGGGETVVCYLFEYLNACKTVSVMATYSNPIKRQSVCGILTRVPPRFRTEKRKKIINRDAKTNFVSFTLFFFCVSFT